METADDLNNPEYSRDDLQENVDLMTNAGNRAAQGAEADSAFGIYGALIGGAAGYIGGAFEGQYMNEQIKAQNEKIHRSVYGSNREQEVTAAVDPLVAAQIPGRVQTVAQPEEVNPATGTTEPPKPSVNGKAFSPIESGGTLDSTFDPSIAQFGTVT